MSDPPRPTPASVLLGVLVGWQFVFVAAAGVAGFVAPARDLPQSAEGTGPAGATGGASPARLALDRWGEATGQMQHWQMFANGWLKQGAYPAAELRFPGGRTVLRRSRFEPDDPTAVRPPTFHTRYLHFEAALIGLDLVLTDEMLAADPEGCRRAAVEGVRGDYGSYLAYARAAARLHREEHPGEPDPDEVIVFAHRYLTPEPGSASAARAFSRRPIARWRPGTPATGFLPVEAFDPVAKQFVPLPAGAP